MATRQKKWTEGHPGEFSTPFAFEPSGSGNKTLDLTTDSAAITLGPGTQVLLTNFGDNAAHFKFSASAAPTATTDDVVVRANSESIFTIPGRDNDPTATVYLAALSNTSTTKLNIVTGYGV